MKRIINLMKEEVLNTPSETFFQKNKLYIILAVIIFLSLTGAGIAFMYRNRKFNITPVKKQSYLR